MKYALTIITTALMLVAHTQTLTPDWARALGNGTEVYTKDIAVDENGNSFLVGSFSGTDINFALGNTTSTSIDAAGVNDAFIAKYNSSGELQWVNTFGSAAANERINAITLNSEGELLVVGFLGNDTGGSGLDLDPGAGTVTVVGQKDALVAKYDTDGNYLNHFVIGGENTGTQEFLDIAVNNGDSIYTVGYLGDPNATVADMDPGTETKNIHANSTINIGMIGFYTPDFEFIYARRTSSNSGNQFSKVVVDSHNKAFTVLEWGMTEQRWDIAIEYEWSPTYEPAYGSRTAIGDQGYNVVNGQTVFIGRGKSSTILQITNTNWRKNIVGGETNNANVIHDLIVTDDKLYAVGVLPKTVYVNTNMESITSINGTHGFIMKTDLSNGANTEFASISTTTTATDYVHSVDTAGSNVLIAGYWNGNPTLDLDPGSGSYTIGHTNDGTYWAQYDADLNYQEGGFLASSDGNTTGMREPFLKSLGNDQYLLAGFQDGSAYYNDTISGPDVIGTGTALSKLNYIPNQPPNVIGSIADVLVEANEENSFRKYLYVDPDTLFEDPEGLEMTYSASVSDATNSDISIYSETNAYTIQMNFLPAFTGTTEVTITATDSESNTADISFNVTTMYAQVMESSYPANGDEFISLDTTISFAYPVNLDANTIADHVTVKSDLRGEVEGTFEVLDDSVVFTPISDFLPNEWIAVSISNTLEPVDNALIKGFYFEFRTGSRVDSNNELTFNEQTLGYQGTQTRGLAIGDLDGDGNLDIVGSSETELDIFYMLNDGLGNYGEPVKISDEVDGYDIELADMDNDGNMDVVSTSRTNRSMRCYYNDGSLTFTEEVISSEVGNFREIEILDYDKDGRLDILQAKTDNFVYLHTQGDNNTFTKTTIKTYVALAGLTSADFDEDGKMDYAYASYLSNAGRLWVKPHRATEIEISTKLIRKITTADMNADGLIDIVYGTVSGEIGWFENDGSNGFTDHGFASGYSSVFEIATGDIDGDGDIDVSYTAPEDNIVAVMINDGSGNLSGQDIFTNTIAHKPYRLEMGDVDGDMDLDVVAVYTNASAAEAQVMVFKNGLIRFDPPEVTSELSSITIDEDTEENTVNNQIDTLFFDPIGEGLTYTFASDTSDISGTIDGRSLSISSTNNFFGEASLHLIAENAAGKDTLHFSIMVNGTDDAPRVSNPIADVSGEEDDFSVTVDLTGVFEELDDEALTYSIELPETATFLEATLTEGVISITGVENGFGESELIVTATDPNEGLARDTFNIAVNAVNDAPVFFLDPTSLTLGRDFSETEVITLTDNSPDNESNQSITYTLTPASVAFANVTIDTTTGEVTITSVSGEFGTQEFTVTADDAQSSNNTAAGTFTLTVLDNEPPVVETSIEDQVFNEDATERVLAADITTLFSDPEGATLSITASSDASDVIVEITDNNNLTYEATPDYFGSATITVAASDGSSIADITFTLTITAVNDAPVVANAVADQLATEDLPFSFSLPAGQFSDVDDEDLSLTVDGLPEWVTFDGLALIMHGTPTNEDVGTSTITITAGDGELTVTDEFTLTVNNVNDAPNFTTVLQNITLTEDAGQVILMNLDTVINDIDGDELYLYAEGQQEVATVSISDNNDLVVDVPANVFGSETIYLYAEDAETFIETTFSLTITPVNDAPVFTIDVDELEFQVNDTQNQMISLIPESPVFGEENEEVAYTILQDDNSIIDVTVNGLEVSVLPIGGTGTESFTIQSNDGQLENNIHEVTVQVTVSQVLGEKVQDIQVYPNPTTDRLNISNIENGHYVVFDEAGSAILNGEITSQGIDVTQLPNGIYTLRLMGGEGGSSLVSRFIKN